MQLQVSGAPTAMHARGVGAAGRGAGRGKARGKGRGQEVRLPPVAGASPPPRSPQKTRPKRGAPTPAPPLAHISSSITPLQRTLAEEALHQLSLPARGGDGSCGRVKVRYNHYRKLFPIHNGVLRWTDVDAEYSFSFVFKGAYSRDLVYVTPNTNNPRLSTAVLSETDDGAKKAVRDGAGDYFLSLADGDELLALVDEDRAAALGASGLTLQGPLKATQLAALGAAPPAVDTKGLSVGAHLLTQELKALAPADLQSAQARELIERRDLEDILFSGP